MSDTSYMALTPPTVQQVEAFRNEGEFASDEEAYVAAVAQQATDAIWVFTGMEDDPTDPRTKRVLTNALCQLTLWLMSQDEHRSEINSPFSSERIGSYSYQKIQQAASTTGETSGIYWLDLFFKLLNSPDSDGIFWSTSENVFNPYGLTFQEQDYLERLDLFSVSYYNAERPDHDGIF